ncbi:hypothetical protein FBY35_6775 [Streptomyces sp. SLBN-118]|nr:hypothetical protein [Streptomyces sp. SLBN-118]TQK45222.1 hypothetical protein FBY35_6775 [Streptomyces sp. SLBN-118]
MATRYVILGSGRRPHITRRDGEDLYLATARHDHKRKEAADIAARLLK